MWFDLDVGLRDDLLVVRFHAMEEAAGRTMRWSQDQSFVSITNLTHGARVGAGLDRARRRISGTPDAGRLEADA